MPIPVSALRYAFDNWQRNGRFFPKPKDILEQVEVYNLHGKPETKFRLCGNCDNGFIRVYEGMTAGGNKIDPKFGAVVKCQCFRGGKPIFEHYGQGYNGGDMAFLWKQFRTKRDQTKRPLNDSEIEHLLAELDKKRGGSPAFRSEL